MILMTSRREIDTDQMRHYAVDDEIEHKKRSFIHSGDVVMTNVIHGLVGHTG